MSTARFVVPPLHVFDYPNGAVYWGRSKSYAYYNYLRPGLIQRLKRRRFELALSLSKPYLHQANVLDIGCADGVFLPSLAHYFNHVVGIDLSEHYLTLARKLVDTMSLSNTSIICSEGMSFPELKTHLRDTYRVAFVLETLEHVGNTTNFYESKADFVDGVFSLLEPDGVIIASVPRMVGIAFLIKHLLQVTLRLRVEPVSFADLMRSAFLRDTTRLEPQWKGGHIGFNHLLLTKALQSRFDVKSIGTLTSVFYVIRRKA